jgi:3-hydroxyisobutyrate dehydrogenase-like beta-hydroxyacid dehydrogenase
MKKIGMIGIGLMGHGIASNLIKHGYTLSVLEHPGNQPLDDLKKAGARACRSVATLAADSEVVILCVTGSPEVEAVVLADGGLIKAMRPGTVVVDCSNALPSSTERVARAVQEAGGRFLDAPMTRTPKEAAEVGSTCWSEARPGSSTKCARCCRLLPKTSPMWVPSAQATG